MSSVIPWEFYVSDLGRPLVEREIEDFRLNTKEGENFSQSMQRVANSASMPHDVSSLGQGLWEVRIRLNHRIGRVLFSTEIEQNCNLALFAGIKKTQRTPTSWIDLAASRRKTWRFRQISV
jgi:phage-related protein